MKVTEQNKDKVYILENELIKSKRLVKYLITDVERVFLEHEKFQNNCTHRETRHKALVEKLKDELCRLMLMQQENIVRRRWNNEENR